MAGIRGRSKLLKRTIRHLGLLHFGSGFNVLAIPLCHTEVADPSRTNQKFRVIGILVPARRWAKTGGNINVQQSQYLAKPPNFDRYNKWT